MATTQGRIFGVGGWVDGSANTVTTCKADYTWRVETLNTGDTHHGNNKVREAQRVKV